MATVGAPLEGATVVANSHVIVGGPALYVLARLWHLLCERLARARQLAAITITTRDASALHPTQAVTLGMDEDVLRLPACKNATEAYGAFMAGCFGYLDGSCPADKFEDLCRALMGSQSYCLFTIDKRLSRSAPASGPGINRCTRC